MRLKILSLFVAIQILSFGIWTNLSHAEPPITQTTEHAQIHPAPAMPSALVDSAEEFSLSLHFVTRNMDEKKRFLNAIKENQIETALKKLPEEHANSVENIILDYNPEAHRGLGGNSMIILRGVNMGTEEMVSVMIHELGHNVDYAYLVPKEEERASVFRDGALTLYETDASLDFYRISWLSNNKRKNAATNMDFVSGYAMSDPFEDFAESYVFYVLHNKDFKVLAASSDALYAKYSFMKHEVFDSLEFDTGDGEIKENLRPWDITVLDYDINQFLS